MGGSSMEFSKSGQDFRRTFLRDHGMASTTRLSSEMPLTWFGQTLSEVSATWCSVRWGAPWLQRFQLRLRAVSIRLQLSATRIPAVIRLNNPCWERLAPLGGMCSD